MGNINPGPTAQVEPIHFSKVFDRGKTPVACGKTEQPLPATNEWRYVDCPACLASAKPEERALREEQERRYPPDRTYVRTELQDQVGKLCSCARCEADGQHEPMCSVHAYDADGKPGACDCVRRP